MRAPLPPRYWRKIVAATQGIVLTVAAADVLPLGRDQAALVVALVLLAESFGRDVLWLWRHRHAATPLQPAADTDPSVDPPPPTRRPAPPDACARALPASLTILAVAARVGRPRRSGPAECSSRPAGS